jgi:Transposase DDE domain
MPAPLNPAEWAAVGQRFAGLLDPDVINAQQPMGPATVYSPWVVVWLLVFQRLHANATLAEAVAELLNATDILPANRRVGEQTLSANTGAYSRARTRLDPAIPDAVADRVFQTLVDATAPSFGNRRVFLLDGTTITLAPTPELTAAFPPWPGPAGSPWPVWHWVVAHELASGCAIRPETGPMYGPEGVSELALATRLLPRLPARSLVLADRNFGVFALVHAAQAAGHDVVTRLTRPRFRAWVKAATPVGPGVWRLRWTPSRWDRTKHPELPADAAVGVWLHEVAVSASLTLWLLTTVDCRPADLAALYRLRQDVETDIRDVKRTLRTDALRGKSVAMVRKELSSSVVAYNLVVQVRRLAAARAGVKPRRLSFAGVWSLVNRVLLNAGPWAWPEWEAKFDWVLRGAAQRRVPNRPGRQYPRVVHGRGQKFPNRPRPGPPPDLK